MPKPAKKVKKTRAKAKNVTQTVIVNVGKRGGGGKAPTTAPPRPTPLQQALQFVQATRLPPQGESLVQSTQVLQRMLEPINRQLQSLQRQSLPSLELNQPQQAINMPAINIAPPSINIAPPAINISQKPQASMASQTEIVAPKGSGLVPIPFPIPPVNGIKAFPPNYQLPQLPLSYHDFVLDLPDAQLVQPAKPLVPGGSLRLDPEHEDVPIVEAERIPVVEADEKEEEAPASASSSEESRRPPIIANNPGSIPLTEQALDKLVFKRHKSTSANVITLEELVKSYYGLPLPRSVLEGGKAGVIKYLIENKGSK